MNLYSHLPSSLINAQLMVQQRIEFINSCSEPISFLRETVSLLDEIHNHPVIGSYFRNLEKTGKKLAYEVQKKLVHLYENEWKFLSKFCHSLIHKKQLVRIRNLVINSYEISSPSVPQKIYESIDELRRNLPLYKELKKIESIVNSFQTIHNVCECPDCKACRNNTETKIICISLESKSISFSFSVYKTTKNPLKLSTRQITPCTNYLTSLFWKNFWNENATITNSGKLCPKFVGTTMGNTLRQGKLCPKFVAITMETDEVYFYCRMRLLKEIIQFQIISFLENKIQRPPKKFDLIYWEKNKMTLWNQEAERSHKISLLFGLTKLYENLSNKRYIEKNPFLCPEYYFTIENIKHYLALLQKRISLIICEGKYKKSSSAEKNVFKPCEYKRIRFREIVKDFWLKNPSVTTEDCYKYYKVRTGNDRYEFSTFKKYIAKDDLDPRPPEQKVRGKSRKSKKRWN